MKKAETILKSPIWSISIHFPYLNDNNNNNNSNDNNNNNYNDDDNW